MLKPLCATTQGIGIVLLLAACGGRPDDASTQSEQNAQVLGARSRSEAAVATATALIQAASSGAALPEGEMAEVKRQLALLTRDVAEIHQQLARAPRSELSAEQIPNPRTDPDARLEAERVEQQRIASTEAAFRGEKEDPRWSQGMVASVRAALGEAQEALRNQVGSVECRSQTCRVVISGDTRGAAGQDLSLAMMRLAETFPNVKAGQIDQGDGRPATVLYLSR